MQWNAFAAGAGEQPATTRAPSFVTAHGGATPSAVAGPAQSGELGVGENSAGVVCPSCALRGHVPVAGEPPCALCGRGGTGREVAGVAPSPPAARRVEVNDEEFLSLFLRAPPPRTLRGVSQGPSLGEGTDIAGRRTRRGWSYSLLHHAG